MAVTTSSVPLVFSTLVDRLLARPGLAGVTVTSGPLAVESWGARTIQLVNTDDTDQAGNIGNTRRAENYIINGLIWSTADGTDEAAIRAARDGAYAMQAELEDELRRQHHVGNNAQCQFAGSVIDQGVTPDGRQRSAAITFRLAVMASLPSN